VQYLHRAWIPNPIPIATYSEATLKFSWAGYPNLGRMLDSATGGGLERISQGLHFICQTIMRGFGLHLASRGAK
jgi:hypothetical protein